MEVIKKSIFLASIVVLVVLGLFLLNLAVTNKNTSTSNFKFISEVEIYKNGELVHKGHNLITNIGFNFTREQLLAPTTGVSLVHISLSNVSGVCTLTATGISELTVCGLTRAAGTVTRFGNNSYIVERTFTLTCDVPNLRVTGLHWSSTAGSTGNLFACFEFPVLNLVTNDQITVRWNVTILETP